MADTSLYYISLGKIMDESKSLLVKSDEYASEITEYLHTPEIADVSETPAADTSAEERAQVKDKPTRIYFEQILCLLLIGGVAYWNSGPRLIAMVVFAVVGTVVMDMIGCALTKKEYNPKDLSTLMAGLCIALLMPSGISYGLVFFGSVLTIAVKHIFGGKDNYIFNPTAVALAFLILCYPGQMLLFPQPRERIPVWGEIDPTTLTRLPSPDELQSTVTSFDILMGNIVGAMGTVHILVLLVSAICLIFRRSVSPTVTITALATTLLFAGVLGGSLSEMFHSVLVVMISGSFLFMLIFLANDPQTLPKTFLGKVYYGLFFGGAVTLFRVFGRVDSYPIFALLLVNTMTERSDILAQQTVSLIKRAVISAKDKLGSYERIRAKAETEVEFFYPTTFASTETLENLISLAQDGAVDELNVDSHNYNMPPIDNKIIKIERKKPNLIIRLKEKLSNISEKRAFSRFAESEKRTQVNFLQNLKDGLKDFGSLFKKKSRQITPEELAQNETAVETELTPLGLSIIIDDNDVVEVESSGKKKAHAK